MFILNQDDLSIYATRGDIVFFAVSAEDEDHVPYHFQAGDVLRIKVYGKKDAEAVVLQKDFPVLEMCEMVEVFLSEEDTKIGEVISKPTDYWYEVELNPGDDPQTIIGYDEDGAKVFKLFPEGADVDAYEPDPEDFPVVDEKLDLTSPRPIANRVVAAALAKLESESKNYHITPQMFGAIGDGDDSGYFVMSGIKFIWGTATADGIQEYPDGITLTNTFYIGCQRMDGESSLHPFANDIRTNKFYLNGTADGKVKWIVIGK